MANVYDKLKSLGISLPTAGAPAAAYVMSAQTGNTVFCRATSRRRTARSGPASSARICRRKTARPPPARSRSTCSRRCTRTPVT